MTRKVLLLTVLLGTIGAGNAVAQTPDAGMTTTTATVTPLSPNDKWEIGIHLGMPTVIGDIDPKFPGIGGALHVRKSLDHVFSIRGVAFGAQTKNENRDNDTRSSELTYLSGSGEVVITLNNLRFNKPVRRFNLNVFLGAGLNYYKTDYENIIKNGNGSVSNGTIDGKDLQGQANAGIELLYRVNPKFNIGVQHNAIFAFGQGADLLDSDDNITINRTTYRDVLHFPNLCLNFNLGGKGKNLSEPLYWVNPMAALQSDIAELKARPVYDPTDTDADGVIDAIDQEKTSPAGARVDTRGMTLDSDADGIADFKDKEPYSPPGYKIDAMGIAQIPKEPKLTEADVTRIVDDKLKGFKPPSQQGIIDWFLPMIHFDLDRYDIKKNEYENLYQVAQVMKQNPSLRVLVSGHTDKLSGNNYNNVLSYNRAKSAIEFLVATHGVSRDRLVLNWGGEDKSLVPGSGNSMMNRRVEFRVATGGDTEMGRPEGPRAGRGSFKGNKDAGY